MSRREGFMIFGLGFAISLPLGGTMLLIGYREELAALMLYALLTYILFVGLFYQPMPCKLDRPRFLVEDPNHVWANEDTLYIQESAGKIHGFLKGKTAGFHYRKQMFCNQYDLFVIKEDGHKVYAATLSDAAYSKVRSSVMEMGYGTLFPFGYDGPPAI